MKYHFLVIRQMFSRYLLKWFVIHILLFLVYLIIIYNSILNDNFNYNYITNILLVENLLSYNFIELLLLIYSISLTIYASYCIYSFEYNNFNECIFLRTNRKKFYITKVFIVVIMVLVIRSLHYCVLYILFKNYYSFDICLYIKSVLIYVFLITFFSILFNNNKILTLLNYR